MFGQECRWILKWQVVATAAAAAGSRSRREESALDWFCTVTRKWPNKYVKNVYNIMEYNLIYVLCALDFFFYALLVVVYMS